MIKLINVSKIYQNNNKATIGLNNVSFELHGNGIVMICGPSGSGKTTLANVIAGLITFDEGNLIFNNQNMSYYNHIQLETYFRDNYYLVKQENNLLYNYTVKDNLILACDDDKMIPLIDHYLQKFNISELAKCKVKDLSQGEVQRVAIIRGLIKQKDIFILDEPIASLDRENAQCVLEMLNIIKKDHMIIIITHDVDMIKPYANRIITMEKGAVAHDEIMDPISEQTFTPKNRAKKIVVKKIFKYGLKNILVTPSKSVLKLLILTLTIFCLAIIKTIMVPEFSEKDYNVKAMTLSKNDGSFLLSSDLNYLANLPINNIENNYGNLFHEKVNFGQGNSVFLIKPYQQQKVIAGKAISSNNEVLVPVTHVNHIGDKIKLHLGNLEKQLFTIVGVTEDPNCLYLRDVFYNNEYITVINIQEYFTQYTFTMPSEKKYGAQSEIYYSHDKKNNLYLSTKFLTEANIDDSIIGQEIAVELIHPQKGNFEYENITATVVLASSEILSNITLELGTTTLNKLALFRNPREVRFNIDKLNDIDQVLLSLSDYTVIYDYEKIQYGQNYYFESLKLLIIYSLIWITLLILILFLFIVFHNNEKHTYDVFRYLGYSKSMIFMMKFIGLFVIFLISFGFNVLIYFILNKSDIRFFINLENLLLTLVPILMCLLLSCAYGTSKQYQILLGEV